jgi:FAD/FMN-containing dehydrogenase
VERPPTEAELVAVLKQAAAAGRRVRVGPPSRSHHHRGSEIFVDLSQYYRLRRVDREARCATAEAGISVAGLWAALGSWGLSMENGSRRPAQALGAAVSTGAHGTGVAFGSLATQVTGLRLITFDGTVINCSATEEPDIFDAARVGRGALGVLSTVTLRFQPGFNLRARVTSLDLDEALDRFDELADGNDHFELSWRPGRRQARVVTANRTDEPADGAEVDRSYRWWSRRRPGAAVIEYSVPRSDSGPALRRARAVSAGSHAAPHFPIEVSTTAGDDIALSPAQGRASVYIAGIAGLEGRPQWGSAHGLSAAALRALYPRWDEWQAVRDRLDPDRRFAQSSGQG